MSNETKKIVLLDFNLVNNLVGYLGSKPMVEVEGFVNALRSSQAVDAESIQIKDGGKKATPAAPPAKHPAAKRPTKKKATTKKK